MQNEVSNIKIFPNNFEAEQSLLGCILIDGEVAAEIIPSTSADLFYHARHKKIFESIQNLAVKNSAIDIITVDDQLTKDKNSDINMLSYLSELINIVPSAANYKEYYNIIKRDTTLRRVITACNKIISDAYKSKDADATLEMAEKEIFDISSGIHQGDLVHISQGSNELMSRIDKMCRDKSYLRGLHTKFPIFDKVTNGLQKGDLIILAARPSVGKTSFVLNIASNIITQGNKDSVIAIFSLEMPSVQLAQRMISTMSSISMTALSRGLPGANDQGRLWQVHTELSSSKIYVDHSGTQTPSNIFSKCRKLASTQKRLDLVIIDYLQLMDSDKERSSKNLEVSDISRKMKQLAREMDCPVVVLSQMSRGIENRDDKSPQLSDLRDSGAIEQDADIVMFLSRENEADKGKPNFNVILDISKHRNGELKAIRYVWEGDNVRFTESTDQYINRELPPKKSHNGKQGQ